MQIVIYDQGYSQSSFKWETAQSNSIIQMFFLKINMILSFDKCSHFNDFYEYYKESPFGIPVSLDSEMRR